MTIDRLMDKDVIHLYNGILLSHEEEWNYVICNDMGTTRGVSLMAQIVKNLSTMSETWVWSRVGQDGYD